MPDTNIWGPGPAGTGGRAAPAGRGGTLTDVKNRDRHERDGHHGPQSPDGDRPQTSCCARTLLGRE